MKVWVIGGGLAGLTAAFHLSGRPDVKVVLYEQESQFGGRANVEAGGEHCPRFFLNDYTVLFGILRQIEGRDGRSVHDSLRRVRRFSHVHGAGWVEISHLYRVFASEIGWGERFRMARAWRPSPLVAEQRRMRRLASSNRYGTMRSYSLMPLLRMGSDVFHAKIGYVLPGPTDAYLIDPWVQHLRVRGVDLRVGVRVRAVQPGVAGVSLRTSEDNHDFDAVVITAYVPDLVTLLDASQLYHSVNDLEQIHCAAFTIELDPREPVLASPEPRFYSHAGTNILVQPEHHRCVVLCAGSASTVEDEVVTTVRRFLDLQHDTGCVVTRRNQRPGEAVYGGNSLRVNRILREPIPRVYFAGSHVRNSYPIDAAESAARSAINAVEALRCDLGLPAVASSLPRPQGRAA
jgi:glycine/D-amino acid oxidase-like deaminating enzyme